MSKIFDDGAKEEAGAFVNLSICIPTYNRGYHLRNCLNSIISCEKPPGFTFEVCVSDNGSEDNTEVVIREMSSVLPIRYRKNTRNRGHAFNFLKVVESARGDYCWLVGDDDLLAPDGLVRLACLMQSNPEVNFFYVNAYLLDIKYLQKFTYPFDTEFLPKSMDRFSSYDIEGPLNFFDLLDKNISFDFLGGMFLSVFKKSNWDSCTDEISEEALCDLRTFSHFDNTFPHIKIFAKAFSRSRAYYNANPPIISLSGVREWSPMYPFIHSVRIVEAIDCYRKAGLPLIQYLLCKNFALHNFVPDYINMILRPRTSGIRYIKCRNLIGNILYPNAYLSVIYFFCRKIKIFLRGVFFER